MNRANLIKLLLMSLTLPSAAVASPQTVWKEKTNYVAIKDDIQAGNNHPYQVEEDKLARILSQLKITHKSSNSLLTLTDSSSNKDSYVFSDREIDVLTQGIHNALEKAAAKEVVTFSVSDFKDVYFGNKNLSVSGTAFIKGENLNLIFGEIHVDLHKKYVRSGQGVSNSRFASNVELANFKLNTGSTAKAGKHNWSLQAFTGATLVNQRHDWISINLDRDYSYSQKSSEQEQLQQKYLSEAQKSEKDAQQSQLEERIKKLEQASSVPPENAIAESSVESRLRKLKALHEQGAIPESIYLEKMRSIINEL